MQRRITLHTALAVTTATGIADSFATPATGRAGLLHLEHTLLHAHLTCAATGTAVDRLAALLRPGTATGIAGRQAGNANLYRGAFNGIFQGDIQCVAQIGAALGAGMAATTATATATKNVAKYIAENIAEVTATAAEAATTAHAGIHTGVTVAVIGATLFVVHQDVVGFGGFLEFLISPGIIRVAIRVVLHRHPTVSLLDLLGVGTLVDTKHFVIIAF